MANIIATNFGEHGAVLDFFDVVGTSAISTAAYSSALGWSNGNGRSMQTGNNASTEKVIPAQGEYYFHFRMKFPQLNTANVFRVMEGATVHVTFNYTPSGFIQCQQGSGTTLFTTTNAYALSVAHDIQIHIIISDTVGVVELRVDGNPANDGSFSAGDTRNGGTGVINRISFASSNGLTDMSDLVINDTTGGSETSWTGPVRVVLAVPTAAGADGTAWTPSVSTNLSNIDDAIPGAANGDTDYNETAVATNKDFFLFGASAWSGLNSAIVHFVRNKYIARSVDAGSHTIRGFCKNTNVANGITNLLNSSYPTDPMSDPFYVDPATSAAWAGFAAIAAAEFGYELVT